jgi:uncharacterized hydrophobic protein (TIGR00341 family)
MVPAGKRETIRDILDSEDIDFVLTDETSNREYAAVVWFPLPDAGVEQILEQLRAAGLDDDAYTVVLAAETVVSENADALEERFATEPDRVAREELLARAKDLAPDVRPYVLLTVISVVVATAGLLLDSPSVVVGSMVIAPLVGPAMSSSVGLVLDDRNLVVRGLKLQVLGALVAVATAAAFALLVKTAFVVPPGLDVVAIPEVNERVAPDVLSLAIALGAGAAGALSLRSGVSTALVGVMIAVALVPPTAVIGIGIAWGLPGVALGSAVLALVNLLSINLAALAVLWYDGYRPQVWFRRDAAKSATLKGIAVLVVVIALLSVFLGAVTYSTFQTSSFETAADAAATATADRYDSLSVIDVAVTYGGNGPAFQTPSRVVVTVGHPPGGAPPEGLPDALKASIAERTERDVAVEVRYTSVATADVSEGLNATATQSGA